MLPHLVYPSLRQALVTTGAVLVAVAVTMLLVGAIDAVWLRLLAWRLQMTA